jgi:hypothetical protein
MDSTATADGAGLYRIAFLPIGRSQAIAEAPGFTDATIPAFGLEALQTDAFNVQMKIGGGQTTVQVSAATPLLDTNDAMLSGTFTARTIENFH